MFECMECGTQFSKSDYVSNNQPLCPKCMSGDVSTYEENRPGEVGTHTTRAISNEQVDRKKRYSQILEVLDGKEMTAKEIAQEMYMRGYIPTNERNFTAPRLTELSESGVVEPIGKKKCEWTGKTVSVFKIREKEE
jgi:hypothetical protein